MASTRLTSFQPVLIHLSVAWLSTVREIVHVLWSVVSESHGNWRAFLVIKLQIDFTPGFVTFLVEWKGR